MTTQILRPPYHFSTPFAFEATGTPSYLSPNGAADRHSGRFTVQGGIHSFSWLSGTASIGTYFYIDTPGIYDVIASVLVTGESRIACPTFPVGLTSVGRLALSSAMAEVMLTATVTDPNDRDVGGQQICLVRQTQSSIASLHTDRRTFERESYALEVKYCDFQETGLYTVTIHPRIRLRAVGLALSSIDFSSSEEKSIELVLVRIQPS